MNFISIISKTSDNTMIIAKKFAKYIKSGDTIILTGELGSGKTKFIEGFLSYYNLQSEISSPTFNIVNEYSCSNVTIYHFDVYRLEDVEEFYLIGGNEYFDKGICLIEWGELIKEALPENYIKIFFEKDFKNENDRRLKFEAVGKEYKKILDTFKEELN